MEGERGARPEEERGDRAEGIRVAWVGLSSVRALLRWAAPPPRPLGLQEKGVARGLGAGAEPWWLDERCHLGHHSSLSLWFLSVTWNQTMIFLLGLLYGLNKVIGSKALELYGR